MKKRTDKSLLIISDLFGIDHIKQDNHYLQEVSQQYSQLGYQHYIYSAPELAKIKHSHQLTEQELHCQFIHKNALEKAAENLVNDRSSYDLAIGFSIGGTMLWQAALKNSGLCRALICISSTRLRYEKSRPYMPHICSFW
ncbi:hypothetical protein [Piscirickettsia litoralis]|uniref:Dienelactone hydrolase domain-containing protein n=1 Tax=Piscirickettsia litoralis TaxID=1891921 RepID=A0ABX3A151_9GAMM|nr:hypothetical protein [Piscirickettsia litoralis]ODN42596.1 hypothetical protein BGC07_06205 [Piscirickettsia litoralis]